MTEAINKRFLRNTNDLILWCVMLDESSFNRRIIQWEEMKNGCSLPKVAQMLELIIKITKDTRGTVRWKERMAKMNEIIIVNYDGEVPTVSGRLLHERLGVETRYNDWFPRMCEYGFEEGVNFNILKNERVQIEGGREVTRNIIDHSLTLPMAKEIAMLQRNDKGKQIRQYLIKVEEAWNTPEMVMSRALKLADGKIRLLESNNTQLKTTNSKLLVDNTLMQPKAEYFDELVDRNLLTSFRDTAKELKVKENVLIGFLLDHKYIFRDRKGKLVPYAGYEEKGLFEVKECFNEKTNWSGTQTLITPKGRETFRLLMVGLKGA
jgi:anti-repressor protein